MKEKIQYLEIYNEISDKLSYRENGYMTNLESIISITEEQTSCKIKMYAFPFDSKVIIRKDEDTINIGVDSELSTLYKKFYLTTALANILTGSDIENKIDYSEIEEDIYCLSLLLLMPKEKFEQALNNYDSFNKLCSLFGVNFDMLKQRIALDCHLKHTKNSKKVKKKTK